MVGSAAVMDIASSSPATQNDWRDFYEAHWEWVYKLVRRMGGGQINVEDAVQDVFVAVLHRLHSFEGRSALRTWLYQICHHTVAEHRRKQRRAARLGAALRMVGLQMGSADADPTPARALESKEALAQVQEILNAMPPKKRDVFFFCEIEQLSSEEVARILGVPAATVRTRLFHARKEFLRRMRRANP